MGAGGEDCGGYVGVAQDVTAEVQYGSVDDELLPLTRCVCGAEWFAWEGPILQTDPSEPYECEHCHAKLYWEQDIRVKCVDYPEPKEQTDDEIL